MRKILFLPILLIAGFLGAMSREPGDASNNPERQNAAQELSPARLRQVAEFQRIIEQEQMRRTNGERGYLPFVPADVLGIAYPADIPHHVLPTRFPAMLAPREQTPPPAPRIEITDAAQNTFAERYRAIAQNLEFLLRDEADSPQQRSRELQAIVNQARLYAREVQDNGNAAYRTSGGFYNRFSRIEHAAERQIAHMQQRQARMYTVHQRVRQPENPLRIVSHLLHRTRTHRNQDETTRGFFDGRDYAGDRLED